LKGQDCVWSYLVDGLDSALSAAKLGNVAAGLAAADPGRLISWHAQHGKQSTDAVAISKTHNYTSAQTGHKDLTAANTTTLQGRAPAGVPWMDDEPCYEGLGQFGTTSYTIGPADVERVAKAGLSRKAGLAYGHIDVALFRGNWKAALDAPGVARFMAVAKGTPAPDPTPTPGDEFTYRPGVDSTVVSVPARFGAWKFHLFSRRKHATIAGPIEGKGPYTIPLSGARIKAGSIAAGDDGTALAFVNTNSAQTGEYRNAGWRIMDPTKDVTGDSTRLKPGEDK